MEHDPNFAAFADAYEAGRATLLHLTLVADLETPVAAFLKLRAGHTGPAFLLESVEGGAVRGRYSMIGLDPDLAWRCREGRAEIARDPGLSDFTPEDAAPLTSLRALIAESAIGAVGESDALPPMAAGLFGYLGYDMVRAMETLGTPNPDPLGVPDAILVRPRVMVVFDAVRDLITVVGPVRPDARIPTRAAYEAALARLESVAAALEGPLPVEARIDPRAIAHPEPVSNTTPDEYLAMVARAKEYIVAGDVFQVVLSQRFEAPFTLPALALYRSLRRTNPAPFLCYLDFETFQLVCSSPEILVRVRDGRVTIRPIAGTRRRGATPAEDKALAQELLADPKERSEHLMLLDLGRNDVGRVARIGSVTVTDSFFLEFYSQVMHIVSNVEGDLDPKHDALAALAAGFPRRHGLGRAQGSGHADHRRTGAREARPLRRLHRLLRRAWRDGHLHRPAHCPGEGRPHARAGRRRHRLRFRPRLGAAGMRQQGQGAVPCGGGCGRVCKPGAAGAVADDRLG